MKRNILLASTMLLASLGGCGDFRQAFGLDKQSPDEYTVVEHAPLTIPPDYGLRPPRNPSERVAEAAPVQEARETVFHARTAGQQDAPSANGLSGGENALLSHAGAAGADSGVRAQVNQETEAAQHPEGSMVDSLLFWKAPPAAPNESIDAEKEAQRLKNNAATGGQPAPRAADLNSK